LTRHPCVGCRPMGKVSAKLVELAEGCLSSWSWAGYAFGDLGALIGRESRDELKLLPTHKTVSRVTD
jgi:hypothetical protein